MGCWGGGEVGGLIRLPRGGAWRDARAAGCGEQVVEEGRHEDLVGDVHGRYAAMWRQQQTELLRSPAAG